MKFSVSPSAFCRAVKHLKAATPTRHSAGSAGSYLLECVGNELTISAANPDLAVSVELPVIGESDGACILPPKALALLTAWSESPAPCVLSRPESDRIEISCGTSRYRLSTDCVENYPLLRVGRPGPAGILSAYHAAEFVSMLKAALPFVSGDELRPKLCGVHLRQEHSRLYVVATDGHVLLEQSVLGGSAQHWDCIVPRDVLRPLLALLTTAAKSDPLLRIRISPPTSCGGIKGGESAPHLSLHLAGYRIDLPLIDGIFPAWRAVFNEHTATRRGAALVESLKLLETCKRMRRWKSRIELSSEPVITSFECCDDHSNTDTLTESVDSIDYTGPRAEVTYNMDLLSLILRAFPELQLVAEFPLAADGATYFHPVESAGPITRRALLMPVRTADPERGLPTPPESSDPLDFTPTISLEIAA